MIDYKDFKLCEKCNKLTPHQINGVSGFAYNCGVCGHPHEQHFFPGLCKVCGIPIGSGEELCNLCKKSAFENEPDHTFNMLYCYVCRNRTKHAVYSDHCLCTVCKNLSTTSNVEDTVATVKLQLLKGVVQKYIESNRNEAVYSELVTLMEQL